MSVYSLLQALCATARCSSSRGRIPLELMLICLYEVTLRYVNTYKQSLQGNAFAEAGNEVG